MILSFIWIKLSKRIWNKREGSRIETNIFIVIYKIKLVVLGKNRRVNKVENVIVIDLGVWENLGLSVDWIVGWMI